MPGHIGKSINPADNMDVNDTLAPMWNDSTLTPNEKALVYACAVLHRRIAQLENSLLKANIKLEEDPTVQQMLANPMTGGRRKRSSKKASKKVSKKTSKKGSKTQKGGKKSSKKASKKTSKKSKKSSKKTSRK